LDSLKVAFLYIQPQNRSQVSFGSLEDLIGADNPVWIIDAFVERFGAWRRSGFRSTNVY